MRVHRTLTAVAGAAVLALGLAACTADGSGGGNKLDWEDSPLNAYLAAGYGSDLSEEDWQAENEKKQKEVENIVAACMQKEGWEYTPFVQTGGMFMSSGDDYDPESEKWVSQYGYGAIKSPWSESMPEPGEQQQDPNQSYVEALSESEQNAYYASLYGPQPTEEEMEAMNSGEYEYEYDWTKSGCSGAAQHEVWDNGEEAVYNRDEFKPLMDAVNEFYTKVFEGSSYDELNAKWASCMADANYSGFKRQEDAQQSIYDKINKFWETYTGDGSDSPEKNPDYLAIADEEIPLALADLKCREKTDYRNAQLRIQFDLEEQFVADHKADLEAYKAAAEQGRAKG